MKRRKRAAAGVPNAAAALGWTQRTLGAARRGRCAHLPEMRFPAPPSRFADASTFPAGCYMRNYCGERPARCANAERAALEEARSVYRDSLVLVPPALRTGDRITEAGAGMIRDWRNE